MQPGRSKPMSSMLALFLLALTALTLTVTPATAAAGSGNAGSIWGAEYFPDVKLVSHEGKELRFFSDLIKGKVVVINFIFTSCPDECALETARLREVQRILGDRVGSDVFMYSISIDPAHDTSKVLKEYAKKFEIGPGWLFLTGKKDEINQLRKKLGLYSEADGVKLEDHNLSLIIGNQGTGQWMKVSPYENPYILATQLGSWLHNWKLPPKEASNYGDAPKLRNISNGESLYRTRCASCHIIGVQEGNGTDRHPLGPDLAGVTRKRDHAWLTRWLTETDKVLAEKDPLAMALLGRYNNLPMPNMRLNSVEVQSLLDYIEQESHRVEHQHNSAEHHHDTHEH